MNRIQARELEDIHRSFQIWIDWSQADTRTFFLIHREKEFFELFSDDILGLIEALRIEYKLHNWRLFIDSSKSGLKAVVLYNGNECPSVPVAYSRVMKETYENMRIVLQKIMCSEHNW